MGLFLYSDRAIFGTEVSISNFPKLLRSHLFAFPNTPDIETLGGELIATDFPEVKVVEFVKEVCNWGGYAGISGRVLKRNPITMIAAALRKAAHYLSQHPDNFAAALAEVNALSSLGTPSFASKHLRFLRPDICPVFDSLLQESLPYSFDASGYAAFARDCIQIASSLTAEKVVNPRERLDGRWFASDVEAAIYAQVVGLEQASS